VYLLTFEMLPMEWPKNISQLKRQTNMKASYPLVAVFSARSTTCTVRARLLVSTAASIKKSPGAKLFGISARREIPPSSVVD
jgi:hypothetical protein